MNYKKLTRVADSHINDDNQGHFVLSMSDYEILDDLVNRAFNNIKNDVASLIDSIEDGETPLRYKPFTNILNKGLEDVQGRLWSLVDKSKRYNDDVEPEDWYERNEHGDFDNLN